MFVMESALHLIMSQAVRYLREAALAPREKQLLRRELSAELVSPLFQNYIHVLKIEFVYPWKVLLFWGQLYDCSSASEATPKTGKMDQYLSVIRVFFA